MILALLLFGVLQSTPVRELLTPELTVERVSRCGLGRPRFRYDKETQMGVIVLRGPTRASDSQLACIDSASPYFEVELSLALKWRFNAIRDARLKAYFKAQGRAWLSAHGLLDRLPTYLPGKTDDRSFARALEQLCGPGAAGALDMAKGGHQLSQAWLARQVKDQPNDASTCLFNMAIVSGFPLGFVGNEAAKP